MKNLLLSKLAALVVVVMVLLIGLDMVANVVRDRQHYRHLTEQSVADSLAGAQTLIGPVIHSACVESWDVETGKGEERRMVEQRREFRLTAMPETLRLNTDAAMQERARGVHKVNAFSLQTRIQAQWGPLTALQPQATIQGSRMQCGAPILMLAVADARGIRTAQLQLDGQELHLKPGTFHPTYARGLHASLPETVRGMAEGLQATLNLELVGTQQVSIVPLGGRTEVQMQSPWPHPSFSGRFLPTERNVRTDGFDAQWRLSSLATTAAQDIAESKPVCMGAVGEDGGAYAGTAHPQTGCVDSFSVAFIDPVNPYSLSDRATKYGVLFIALTFVAVGLFELMQRLRVHPVQYLLVGSALCSFFLLLVSLSEHLPFAAAYGIAATACVLLLGYYATHMLGSLRRGLPFGAGIAVLYGMLYVLLQLEQTALAVGSVALFAVLATVMVLTRRVDWYATTAKLAPPPARQRAGTTPSVGAA